jgi:hypothetical protein
VKSPLLRQAVVFLAATLTAGCTDKSLTPTDAGSDGPRTVNPTAAIQPCGGSVTATGTTPEGTFTGTMVSSRYGACDSVLVTIGDPTDQLSLSFSVQLHTADGGTVATGTETVIVDLHDNQGRTTSTLTTETTSADDVYARESLDGGAPDGGPQGQIAGTFKLSQDGFSIEGTFSTPYCQLNLLPQLCTD